MGGVTALTSIHVRRGEFCHRRGLETLAPISGTIVLKCHGRNNTVMGHFLCALTVLTTAASGAGSCIFRLTFVFSSVSCLSRYRSEARRETKLKC